MHNFVAYTQNPKIVIFSTRDTPGNELLTSFDSASFVFPHKQIEMASKYMVSWIKVILIQI